MAATMEQVNYFRNMSDTTYHLATDWTADALCGARPAMKQYGWMFGADNTVFTGITDDEICTDCQDANYERAKAAATR